MVANQSVSYKIVILLGVQKLKVAMETRPQHQSTNVQQTTHETLV